MPSTPKVTPRTNLPPDPHHPAHPWPRWHGTTTHLCAHHFQTHPVLVVDDLHQAAMFGLDRRGRDGFFRLWWFGCFFLQLLLWKEKGEEEGESQQETQQSLSTRDSLWCRDRGRNRHGRRLPASHGQAGAGEREESSQQPQPRKRSAGCPRHRPCARGSACFGYGG